MTTQGFAKMTFLPALFVLLGSILALSTIVEADSHTCDSPGTLLCDYTSTPPTLDANLSEWESVSGIQTDIYKLGRILFPYGQVSYKCLYDDTNIYFSLEIPGDYRFDSSNDRLCAAIGTMFKVGSSATYDAMGGCPDAANGCPDGVPDSCTDYIVDLGAHWELKTTEMGVEYPINIADGTGNDPVANKDDEFGVSSFCRPDDNDADAGNEWAGAWLHTNPVDGESGTYKFEMSRLLSTSSSVSDAQLQGNASYKFGIAYWDPFEYDFGWTKVGHYLTGCSEKWIDLKLNAQDGTEPAADASVDAPVECLSPGTMTCSYTQSAPTLDADLSEWDSVSGIETDIYKLGRIPFPYGQVSYKCLYDDSQIYFSLEVPGDYRFSSESDRFCAAIGTMFKVGSKATYHGMGGCPDAATGCDEGVPDSCSDYLVDLGAHWELKTTERGVEYPMNATSGTGNDPVANNDDEYGVSSFCRFDDDDTDAGNEWSGAWTHTNPVDGETGVYKFEISRLLTTASNTTDAQLASGETFKFGIAYWDPFEYEEIGWTKAGHYLTGCSDQWIDLVLEGKDVTPTSDGVVARTGGLVALWAGMMVLMS